MIHLECLWHMPEQEVKRLNKTNCSNFTRSR